MLKVETFVEQMFSVQIRSSRLILTLFLQVGMEVPEVLNLFRLIHKFYFDSRIGTISERGLPISIGNCNSAT